MKTKLFTLLLICILLISGTSWAAFIVESHSSGWANENFTGTPRTSIRSNAVGCKATNSAFGSTGDHVYIYSYTPGVDVDNFFPNEGTNFGNNDLSSGLAGGAPGFYNVYITWPASGNVNPAGCKITITNEGDDVVLEKVDMNTGGTGTPGGNDGWYRIAERVPLMINQTYQVSQEANDPTYVSMRSHGVMWELVEAAEPLADIVETDGSTVVAEGGFDDTYTIALKEQPSENIILTAEATDPNQLILNGKHNKVEFRFTPEDWETVYEVTVKANDDIEVEGDHKVMILHLTRPEGDPNDADPNSPYTNGYAGIVMVDITDNEAPDVRITESDGNTDVSEEGPTSDVYTIRLLFPPTDNVTVSIGTDGQTTVDPAELVFTPGNWADEQTVTVTAVDDGDLERNHTSIIAHVLSSLDGGYDGLAVADLIVDIEDNECGTWGYTGMDFDQNCVVNLADFAEFAAQWLVCTQPYGDGCIDLR